MSCRSVGAPRRAAARWFHRIGEYVNRKNPMIHTIEGYFSIFKRGMKGVYQHCGKRHLHRYAAEFEFRHNNRSGNGIDDSMRAGRVLESCIGKRLMYRDSRP